MMRRVRFKSLHQQMKDPPILGNLDKGQMYDSREHRPANDKCLPPVIARGYYSKHMVITESSLQLPVHGC